MMSTFYNQQNNVLCIRLCNVDLFCSVRMHFRSCGLCNDCFASRKMSILCEKCKTFPVKTQSAYHRNKAINRMWKHEVVNNTMCSVAAQNRLLRGHADYARIVTLHQKNRTSQGIAPHARRNQFIRKGQLRKSINRID